MKLKLIQTKQVYNLYRPDTGCFIGLIPGVLHGYRTLKLNFSLGLDSRKTTNTFY